VGEGVRAHHDVGQPRADDVVQGLSDALALPVADLNDLALQLAVPGHVGARHDEVLHSPRFVPEGRK
jgi:hypothetical protein